MGIFIGIFMAVIVGLILLTASAQQVGDVTNTIDVANESVASSNGTTLALIVELQGKSVSDVVVYNGSDDMVVTSGNYTIYNNQVIDGTETAGINVSTDVTQQGEAWNVSYTYEPTTYISDGGGRVVAGIIVLMFALAIAIVALIPAMRSKVLGVGK